MQEPSFLVFPLMSESYSFLFFFAKPQLLLLHCGGVKFFSNGVISVALSIKRAN